MKLTQKEEVFVQAILSGETQRKAYRKAYPKSEKWKDETVDVKACNFAKQDKIRLRIAELRAEVTKESKWTLEKLIKEFEEIKEMAKKNCDLSPANKSLENIGKLLGYYTEKIEHSGMIDINIDIEDDEDG